MAVTREQFDIEHPLLAKTPPFERGITLNQFQLEQWEKWHKAMNITQAQVEEARRKFESEHKQTTFRDDYGWRKLPGMGGSLNAPKKRTKRSAE